MSSKLTSALGDLEEAAALEEVTARLEDGRESYRDPRRLP